MEEDTPTRRCMIISASIAPKVIALTDRFGPSAANMWTTPLSSTGDKPDTHYINEGMIGQSFADMLEHAEALQAGCLALGIEITLSDCEAMLKDSDISKEEPFVAMERLGLKLIQVGNLQ